MMPISALFGPVLGLHVLSITDKAQVPQAGSSKEIQWILPDQCHLFAADPTAIHHQIYNVNSAGASLIMSISGIPTGDLLARFPGIERYAFYPLPFDVIDGNACTLHACLSYS